jgi:hypothetical protein
LVVFEPETLGSSGKHTNHYTTEASMRPYKGNGSKVPYIQNITRKKVVSFTLRPLYPWEHNPGILRGRVSLAI